MSERQWRKLVWWCFCVQYLLCNGVSRQKHPYIQSWQENAVRNSLYNDNKKRFFPEFNEWNLSDSKIIRFKIRQLYQIHIVCNEINLPWPSHLRINGNEMLCAYWRQPFVLIHQLMWFSEAILAYSLTIEMLTFDMASLKRLHTHTRLVILLFLFHWLVWNMLVLCTVFWLPQIISVVIMTES